MARKIAQKRLKIPTLFFNGQAWEPISQYPHFQVFTDKILAEVLQVSPMTISAWRAKNVIPFNFTLTGSYAVYNVNEVIAALKAAGYKVDPTLKSTII